MSNLSRRGLLGAFIAAPAIIRTPGLLMAIKPVRLSDTVAAVDYGVGPMTFPPGGLFIVQASEDGEQWRDVAPIILPNGAMVMPAPFMRVECRVNGNGQYAFGLSRSDA